MSLPEAHAPLQLVLQRLGQTVAVQALCHRPHMHLVVIGQGLAAQGLVDNAAQRVQRDTHAYHRAVAFMAQFP